MLNVIAGQTSERRRSERKTLLLERGKSLVGIDETPTMKLKRRESKRPKTGLFKEKLFIATKVMKYAIDEGRGGY